MGRKDDPQSRHLAGRQTVKKPILKLTDEDYNEHGLQELLAARGSAYDINIEVFRTLQETITGWPGGKPAVRETPQADIRPPHRCHLPQARRRSSRRTRMTMSSRMGGTLIRLVDQGHEVHVAYQTSRQHRRLR